MHCTNVLRVECHRSENYEQNQGYNPLVGFLNSNSKIPVLVQSAENEKGPHLKKLSPNKVEAKDAIILSKIPVLKQIKLSLTELNCKSRNIVGNNLTAAVRRQKFHQSRHPAANVDESKLNFWGVFPVCSAPVSLPPDKKFLPALFSEKNLKKISNKSQPSYNLGNKSKKSEAVNCTELFAVENISRSQQHTSKVSLPPISINSKYCSSLATESQQGKKKKAFGEFTHFPAICNVLPFKGVKLPLNSVTILPKLSYSPLAPPPSISTSLEKDVSPVGSVCRFKMQDFCEAQATSVANNQKLVPQIEKNNSSLDYQQILPPHLLHTVSIVVEPVDIEITEAKDDSCREEDTNSASSDSTVKTLMDLAQLRKEAFARLLEEHAEIVEEIKKAETGQI